MPDLPCLERTDKRLDLLNPGCDNDFSVSDGPTQQTTGNKVMCCYTVRYRTDSNCAVGRPLWSGDTLVVAALTTVGGWG